MKVQLMHETEAALQQRLKAAGGEARPEVWRKLTAHAKIRLCEAFESTSACLRSGTRVEESIEPGQKTPQDRSSGERGVPGGDVPAATKEGQYHDLIDHGYKLTGGHAAFMSAQDRTSLDLLKKNLLTIGDRPRSKGPVEQEDFPEVIRAGYRGPEFLERARQLEKQFLELQAHGMARGTLDEFLRVHMPELEKNS